MAKEFKLTRERLKELEAELHYLKTTREKEVAEMIKEARSFGDLSENSEYDEAKNEQAKVEAAIAELEEQLKHVRVVAEINTDSIGIGTKVMVRDLDFEEDIEYTLVGSNEADALENKISDQSPIGRAIIGAKVGDILSIAIPAGQMRIQILSISK